MTASSSSSPWRKLSKPPPLPPPPPPGLPTLCLAGPQLRLDGINEVAVDVLQLQNADHFSGSEWLQVDHTDAHAILERLVQDSGAYKWGQNEPPILKYRVGPTRAVAEVLVSASQNHSNETVYTITLLRPASPARLDAVGPGPPRRFAARVPQLDTVAATTGAATAPISISSSASGIPAPAPTTSPSALNGLSGSDASRSASFSSGYSLSSRKAASRPAVGPERRNLPLSPEMTSMLAHATGLVTGKSYPTTRRPSDARPDDAETNDSTLEDKLPRSVSVLVGRTQSLDRGIEALSDGTDRSAGKPLPFRVPTRAERDAHSPSPSASPPGEPESGRTEDPLTSGAATPANASTRPASPTLSLNDSPEALRRQTLTLHNLVDMVETVPMVSVPLSPSRQPQLSQKEHSLTNAPSSRSCSWRT